MKTEAQQTRPLILALKEAMPGATIFKHADRFTSAIPDISVNWVQTAWLEVKVAERDRIRWHKNWGVQLYTCRRLASNTGLCWFVIYSETSVGLYVPSEVGENCYFGPPIASFTGPDHAAIAHEVQERLLGHHAQRR